VINVLNSVRNHTYHIWLGETKMRMWQELERFMKAGLSAVTPRSEYRWNRAIPSRFVNPARELGISMTGERTVRFVRKNLPYRQITEVPEYRFDDIRKDDIVIDIGANVGAFCIRAAQYSDRITAIEPVAWELLEENIRLNRVKVEVIRGALGNGSQRDITWDDAMVRVPTYTLREIIRMASGCNFLKCDCEGAEWLIQPEDLSGIRRIEMELHLPPIGGHPNEALLDYISRHYDFGMERMPCHDVLGVMGILHATRRDK